MHECNAHNYISTQFVYLNYEMLQQRSKIVRHNCKAHLIVGIREGRWTVTYFVEEQTPPLVLQHERARYYRSHRKVPEEDYQMIVALHNRNISTSDIMGILADEHGGNPKNPAICQTRCYKLKVKAA